MTPRQKAAFWSLERDAWKRYAAGCGIRVSDQAEHDAWRRAEIRVATDGKAGSSKDIGTGPQYEAVMLHFAILANAQHAINHYSAAAENRVANIIRFKLRQLSWMTGETKTWEYARGIFVQMRLPDSIMDVPADLAVKVLAALDTQVRRLCAAADIRPADARRAMLAEAPWLPLKTDRENHPLWNPENARHELHPAHAD